jgi:HEPN domain-containing protein
MTRNTPGLRDAVVFHAQQCVEKLLKARLIQIGQAVDKIHDLAALSRQLEAVDDQWSWDGEELADLSSGAVLARYPGFEISAEEQAELVEFASNVRQALKILLDSEQQEI